MKAIIVKLLVEDAMNPCDDEAIRHVQEMISEIFGKEEMKENPRCKLIFMEVTWDK